MLKSVRAGLVCAAAVLVGCGGRASEDDGGSVGTGGGFGGNDGDTGQTGGDGAGEDGSPRFDVGGGGDGSGGGGDPDADEACKKVDFLFVIDNSASLREEQSNLIDSFPGFVSSIQATLEQVDDYHVGIATSDAYRFNGGGCNEIGALVTETGGMDASMSSCGPFAGGGRFMTEADDLGPSFACAAQVGTGGNNDEKMMQAATRAIAPDMNGSGGCNEGFIRSDALLVLVLITDEDDPGSCILGTSCQGSPGDPPTWYENFIRIKGMESNVVVLSMVWGAPGNTCGPAPGTEKPGQRIMDFTDMFSNGFVGDICAASYDSFFNEAVSVIDSACDDFIPPE